MNLTKTIFVKIVTVGSRVFVTSFQVAGVQGKVVDSPEKAYDEIKQLTSDPSIGLILVSDDMSNPITDKLTSLRIAKSTPLVFSLPSQGGKKSIDYGMMLKKILGV